MGDLAGLFSQHEIVPNVIDQAPREKLNVSQESSARVGVYAL